MEAEKIRNLLNEMHNRLDDIDRLYNPEDYGSEEAIEELEELERLARIGKATEKAFEKTDVAMFLAHWQDGEDGPFYVDEKHSYEFDSIEELINWAESEGE